MNMRSLFFSAALLTAVSSAAQVEESAVSKYPESLPDVPENLRYPAGASFDIDRDGNFLVGGKIRWILGAQPCKGYEYKDIFHTPGYPDALKWIYERTLNYETAQRLGLDSVAPFTSNRFLRRLVPDHPKAVLSKSRIETTRELADSGLPLQIDFTSVPWDKGMLNSDNPVWDKVRSPDANNAFHKGTINHWVPYNVFHPDARKIYRAYWEDGIDEFKGRSPVLCYELFNEPGYDDPGPYNRGLFAEYLKKKYKTPETMNRLWKSAYPNFKAAAGFVRKTENAGLAVDWGKFMEKGFTDLCVFGANIIRAKVPGARLSFQPCGDLYRAMTRSNVNPYEINRHLNVLSVGTGGGIRFGNVTMPPENTIDSPSNNPVVGEGILHRLFFLSIGRGKPIVNGELYVGRTAGEMKRSLWLDLLRGSNASYCFEWSKRAWDWHPRTAEGGARCAEREPYHLVNPYNRCELWGIMEAKKEIFRFRKYFIPRERGVKNDVAVLISYPTERISEVNGNIAVDEIRNYACALAFSHIPFELLLEEQLPEGRANRFRAIAAVGVRNIYPATVQYLSDYVRKGGILILGREFMLEDEYGHPSGWDKILNIQTRRTDGAPTLPLKLSGRTSDILPGTPKGRNTHEIVSAPEWDTRAFSAGKGVVFSRQYGKGTIYLVTPEMQDYSVAAVILPLLAEHGIRPDVRLTRAGKGDLEPNVEIFSAKRGGNTLYFLMNLDKYPKKADFSILSPGKGTYLFPLDNTRPEVKNRSVRVFLPGSGYTIIGFGDEKELASEFGAFRKISVEETEKKYASAVEDFKRILEEQEKGKFRFKPDPSRTRTINIRKYCNRGFVDSIAEDGVGGWTDQGRKNSLTGVPWGERKLLGVPCELIRYDMNNGNSCIVLSSTSQKGKLPDIVKDIRIGGKVRALYFFHTAAWVSSGKPALVYRIHYSSGKILDVPAITGRDIGNWWIGGNMKKYAAFENRFGRGFHCMEWVNPHPEDEVSALDLVSMKSRIVPIVVAISAEEYIPREIRKFEGVKPFGWGGLKIVPSVTGEFEVVISGKTHPWAGFGFRMSNPARFRLGREAWKNARFIFEINGGRDSFGNFRGAQSLKMSFRSHAGKKEISTNSVQTARFLDAGQIDSNPKSFQTVSVPLKEVRGAEKIGYGFDTFSMQFNGTGSTSGVIVRNFRVELPMR